MMKEEVQIRIYDKADEALMEIVSLHRDIFENSILCGSLIYYDHNFSSYLKSLIDKSKDDKIFVLIYQGKVHGFLHLKFFGSTLFLNNICLGESLRGKGLGNYFLKKALELVADQRFELFSLDVLESNDQVKEWYGKLGLKESYYSQWFKIIDGFNPKQKSSDFIIKTDSNGFESIFLLDKKVATVVNGNIILHDLQILKFLDGNSYLNVFTNQPLSDGQTSFRHEIVETSCRMEVSLSFLKDKLKNV